MIELLCSVCNKTFERKHNKQRHCSPACRLIYSNNLKRTKHKPRLLYKFNNPLKRPKKWTPLPLLPSKHVLSDYDMECIDAL